MPTRGQMGIPHRREDWNAIPQFGGPMMGLRLDLSLTNQTLYAGCEIEEVAGRLNLKTPVSEAVGAVGRNVAGIVAALPPEHRTECHLTGPMAVWAYLVCFHAVVHTFARVYYDDGRNGAVLIAAHG